MHCAIVIGHSPQRPGAVNDAAGVSEYDFNSHLARLIGAAASSDDFPVDVILMERGDGPGAYHRLPERINQRGPRFVISLHANAFDGETSGTEVLYWHRSKAGRLLAETLQAELREALELPDRGVKPCTREDRGGYLLMRTAAPCVIAEPFFIDNDGDLEVAQQRKKRLALAYKTAIERYASQHNASQHEATQNKYA